MGLSVLVPADLESLEVTVSWGDYVYEGGEEEEDSAGDQGAEKTSHDQLSFEEEEEKNVAESVSGEGSTEGVGNLTPGWRRKPREETVPILLNAREKPLEETVPHGSGLSLVVTVRPVSATAIGADRLPVGTRSVALFLVNRRRPDLKRKYRAFAFQTSLQLKADKPFVSRPDLRTNFGSDVGGQWDDQVADLQYRDVFEYAVGHGVSVTSDMDASGKCSLVRTTWIPCGEVEWIAPAEIPDVKLGMEELGSLADAQETAAKLKPLTDHYRSWINDQRSRLRALDAQRTDTAKGLLIQAEHAAKRIDAGISMLSEPDVLEAFRVCEPHNGDGGATPRSDSKIDRDVKRSATALAPLPVSLHPDDLAQHRRANARRS